MRRGLGESFLFFGRGSLVLDDWRRVVRVGCGGMCLLTGGGDSLGLRSAECSIDLLWLKLMLGGK